MRFGRAADADYPHPLPQQEIDEARAGERVARENQNRTGSRHLLPPARPVLVQPLHDHVPDDELHVLGYLHVVNHEVDGHVR